MCETCGCQETNQEEEHHHHHPDHSHAHTHKRTIQVEQNIWEINNQIAHRNRAFFDQNQLRVLNLMSSPGTGKTTLLEKTLEILPEGIQVAIITGDQQTDLDARRLQKKGRVIKQINTISSCHLDSAMIEKELGGDINGSLDFLIIENVGNLVCPAAFDLGEHMKVALLSTTEGEDKPLKYPVLFRKADLVLITKTDLTPHLDWDREKCLAYIRQSAPQAKILEISARTGEGMDAWMDYLMQAKEQKVFVDKEV